MIDLTIELRPKTIATLHRFGEDFRLDPTNPRDLAFLIEIMRHVKDASYNFPAGKYDTIEACKILVSNYAKRITNMLYPMGVVK